MVLPTFQPQNPAISGYKYGWSSCTTFAGAMAASFDKQVPELVTGGTLRNETGDFVGGTTLAQIDEALTTHQGVNLDVRYRLPWTQFEARVRGGAGAVLDIYYGPIAASRFDAGNGFKGNHAVFIPPNFGVMDPLADGRFAGVYKYHGEVYPAALLKDAAGKLNLGVGSYVPLGTGLVYAAFTQEHTKDWYATIRPAGTAFTRYFVGDVGHGPQIRGREHRVTRSGFSLRCTAPRLVWERPAGDGTPTTKRSIVEVAGPSPAYDNFWVDSSWAEEK